ncbi:hypothetical protein HHK36_013439 [Tetracentron sinense]|uniref:DUF659 domain-containing protein n=1 Tax=Tetracentron sinense TaxID=13715 RepID=A0A835DDC4_TETSI|nr:hypothetical protein HHK36_013439 [Tetracentron sinense]
MDLVERRGQQCSSVDDDMLEKFHKMEDAAQTKKALKEASSGSSANIPLPKFEDFGKKKTSSGISKSFNVVARDELDHLIARTFYASDLSFNLIRLRTTLLQAEKANVKLHIKSIRQSWTRKGVSIVSDGWTDSNRKRSLINFMATSENGPVFLKVVDATEEVNRLKNKDMTERYKQFKWIGQIDEEAKLIRNFVVNHSAAFTIYNKYSKLKLLGVTETRFASTLILVTRIFQVKSDLQCMVIDEEFSETIVSMLRVADTDTPMLHLVYEKWDSMIEEIRKRVFRHEKKNTLSNESKFYDEVHEILVRRWNKSSTLLHCLAHSLNPKYYSNEWLAKGIGRVPPNLDEEISAGRNACFERLFSSITMLRKVREEYGKFAAAISYFGRWEALSEWYTINPLAW